MKNMKNMTQTSFILAMLSLTMASCTKTTTINGSKKTTATTSTSTTTDGGTTTTTDPTNPVHGCDGVYRSGATSCYYKNIPRLVFSGLPDKVTYGPTMWSSSTGLPSSISPGQFRTDASFSVRMKPSAPLGGELSKQGKTCGPYLVNNFSKIKVFVMLRRSVDSLGEVKELTASVNAYSNTARFTVPGGTAEPYIMEIVGLASNHRCQASIYGALSSTQTAACNAGTLYLDIPLRLPTSTVSNPVTECVAFNLEMATDSTYDLPN